MSNRRRTPVYPRELNDEVSSFADRTSSSSWSSWSSRPHMSTPPKKLSLDYLLNKDQNQSDENGRRRPRPIPSTASQIPTTPMAISDIPIPSNFPHHHPAGSSSEHARAGHPPFPPSTPASASSHLANSALHLQRHFKCEICNKSFVERGNLNKHISSVHLKEKNKVCPEPGCGKSFSFRDGLVRHITHVHKNQRRYSCQLCNKSFKQASHLAKHMRSIHKQQ